MWRPQLDSLSPDFPVESFDLPGHGSRSDSSFDFESAVAVLGDIVESLEPPVVLVGHSLGGYIVMEYAARNPDDVIGIVCSGSSADYRGWLGLRTRVTAALFRIGGRISFVERWFLDRTAIQIRDLPVSEATAEAIIDGGFYLHSWGESGRSLVGRDFHQRLRQFEKPVLLVNGERDTLNTPNAEKLSVDQSNIESVVIDDVGHLCNLQATEEYTDTVRRFVDELRSDRGSDTAA